MRRRRAIGEGYVEESEVDADHEEGLNEEGGSEVGAEPVVYSVHEIN